MVKYLNISFQGKNEKQDMQVNLILSIHKKTSS